MILPEQDFKAWKYCNDQNEGKERKKNRWDKQKTNSNMTDIHLTVSKITLKVNGLNTLIKKQRLSYWTK